MSSEKMNTHSVKKAEAGREREKEIFSPGSMPLLLPGQPVQQPDMNVIEAAI